MFDESKSGLISAEDLRKAMLGMGEALSEEDFEEMLKDAEVSADGKIAYECNYIFAS